MNCLPGSTEQTSAVRRNPAITLIEVFFAFVLVHVTYRAVKHFTVIGQWEAAIQTNFTPGVVMILFTVIVVLLSRGSAEAYGLTLKGWSYSLTLGLFWTVFIAVVGAVGLMLVRIQFDPSRPPDPNASIQTTRSLIGAASGLAAVVVMLWTFYRHKRTELWPPVVSVVALLGLLSLPLFVAWHFDRLLSPVALTVLWLFFGAGFGEEIFFRGYIQSRVDQAFHRRLRIRGIDLRFGLIVSSLLFGFLHTLNTVDYFHGRFEFGWGYGVQNFFWGLFYGCLRAKTGSILAGAISHGLLDVLGRIPALIPR